MPKKKTKTKRKTVRPVNPVKKKAVRTPRTPKVTSPPSSGKRKESLRAILVARRKALLREMEEHLRRHLQGALPARENEVLDSGDMATQDVSEDMNLSFQQRRTQDFKSIDEALQRLEDGTYGICEECGINIPESRLAALPFAKYCVPCKEYQEILERIAKEEDRSK